MKRIAYVGIAAIFLMGVLALPVAAQSDSLGDYARNIRKDKEKEKQPASAKKYDNDNLPRNETLSIVGNATNEPAADAKRPPSKPAISPGSAPKRAQGLAG